MSFSSNQPLVSNQLPISQEFPRVDPDFDQVLSLHMKRISDTVNTKEGALYLPQELATFQQYFTSDPQRTRSVYRKVIDTGALPNATIKAVPHGITFDVNSTTTRIYGSATDPVAIVYIPLPFVEIIPANGAQIYVDGTNVYIRTGINRTNFTRSTVVIEWTKNL